MLPLHGGGFWVALLQLSVFYYVCGAVLHWLVPALLPVKNIQPKQRNDGDVLRDAVYSVGPIIVKAGVWTVVEHMHRGGITQLYVGSFSTWSDVVYLLFQIAFLDCVHDTWFYWTHRLLHWKPLYRHIHYIHHKSNAPSAFTGYSFHIVEALIVFANEILVCWMLPLHASVHRLYHIFTTLIHLGGHAGYEIAPFIPSVEALFCLFLGQRGSHTVLNTVQHHDLHHRYPTKHFSLYFTHWDRLMGTLHPGYDATLFSYFSHSKAG